MNTENKRNLSVDLAKTAATFCVILIHVTGLSYVLNWQGMADKPFVTRLVVRGCGWAVGDRGNYIYTNSVAWGENYVSWYNDKAETQFNLQNSVYSYIALIPTGA